MKSTPEIRLMRRNRLVNPVTLTLHPDVIRVLGRLKRLPVVIEKISGIDVRVSQRGSYRVDFPDGKAIKVRCLASSDLARRVHRVNQQVGSGLLSTIMMRHGCAVVEEWIEGMPLKATDSSLNHCCAAGQLLGRIHSLPQDDTFSDYAHTISTRIGQVRDAAQLLLNSDVISTSEASAILKIVQDSAPVDIEHGFIHGDLAAENTVCDGMNLFAIDNGGLSYDSPEFDLARTWYRWPMNDLQRDAFYQGYHRYRSSAQFQQHFAFWTTHVLCRATLFHIREKTGGQHIPLDRLRKLIKGCPQTARQTTCEDRIADDV